MGKIENSCYVIAEAGLNHNGSIDIAKKLIDDSGLDVYSVIEFQEAADKVQEVLA